MAHKQHHDLLEILHECMTDCNHCYNACLKEEDVNSMAMCIRLDWECADICGYLEQAISRSTPFISEIAAPCAKICEAYGSESKKHDHEHCQKCAETCFICAKACRNVA